MTSHHAAQSPPAWQGHKYAESTDSEVSFFDTSTSATSDSWSNYFEGWNLGTSDDYCPHIVSASTNNSPVRAGHVSTPAPKATHSIETEDDLLPSAGPRRRHKSEGDNHAHLARSKRGTINTKRFGMVPYSDPAPGDKAISQMNITLQNCMSNTEDILSAMYNPNWDVASLQKWYHQSAQTPADLALFKIMFSLRYTAEEIVTSASM